MESEFFIPDLGRATVTRRTTTVAILTAMVMFAIAAIAAFADAIPIGHIGGFVSVCTTVWLGAQTLTAALLFGQFYITRATGFIIYACAYEFGALVMLPYFASVDGLGLHPATQIGDRQLTGILWATWHLGFPLIVAYGLAFDPDLARRPMSSRRVGRVLALAALGTLAATAAIVAAIWIARDHLPIVVQGGVPTPFYRNALSRGVALVNAIVCALALVRGRGLSLGVWLALATFSATLNAVIGGASAHAYSVGWYLAKVVLTLAATVVFAMLAFEIASLYRRLADLATRDALTGLRNRRGFEEYLEWAAARARRQHTEFGLLVIDVDRFKRFNDRYGHVAGDLALRRVADILGDATVRRDDLAARYGGEEFVVAASDVTLDETIAIAERIRARLAHTEIAHAGVPSGQLSVSIGVAHTTRTQASELFATADRALFRAKEEGRDRICASDESDETDRDSDLTSKRRASSPALAEKRTGHLD